MSAYAQATHRNEECENQTTRNAFGLSRAIAAARDHGGPICTRGAQ